MSSTTPITVLVILGVLIVVFLGWRHVSAGWSDDPRSAAT